MKGKPTKVTSADRMSSHFSCECASSALQAIAVKVEQLLATPSAFSVVLGLDFFHARKDTRIIRYAPYPPYTPYNQNSGASARIIRDADTSQVVRGRDWY